MSRIADLSERRRRLWARPWHLWQSDQEARVNLLTKKLEEEYAEKRRENAESDVSRGSRTRTRRHG